MEGNVSEKRQRMPRERSGKTHKVEIYDEVYGGVQEGYIIANVQADGTLGEVFLQGFGKEGSTLEGWIQVVAILMSTAIQYGAESAVLFRKLRYTSFPPYGKTDNPQIPYCRSVPDYVVHWLALTFGDGALKRDMLRIDKELKE